MLNEQSACDVIDLLEYWAEEPPAHRLLAMRYLGPSKRAQGGASSPRSTAVDAETAVSQIPLLAQALHMPVARVSARTRALFDYAQEALKTPQS